jgi:hypothetical protein
MPDCLEQLNQPKAHDAMITIEFGVGEIRSDALVGSF